MALATNATKLANLFNPEVVADLVDTKLVDAIRFAPLARIDTTLVGRAGDTVTLPSYAYIGDAVVVGEGEDIPIKQLTQSTKDVKIHKIGNGVQITDEAALSGYGDPVGEAADQLVLSIASEVDNEMLDILENATLTHAAGGALSADVIADALIKFGEDIDGPKVIVMDPTAYGAIRKADDWIPNTEMGAAMIVRGTVGMVHGCQIVLSNKLTGKKVAYIVKPGALATYMKRDTMVEFDRDIINKSTVMTADKHFVNYLYDASKAIKITLT
jgi:N4-gp56 family major capsid protein